jgi:hypothetical protein
VATATARPEKLTQTILAKAFRGELAPTEADLALPPVSKVIRNGQRAD